MPTGPLIIVSGPSGSGKSTLIHRVVALGDPATPVRLAISATTRPRREGERDGVDYHFWSRERFDEELQRGAFLEHAVVHGQHCYGTLRSEVDPYRERGVGVILDVDVQGYQAIRPLYQDHLSVFVKLSSERMYEERLRKRGTEAEAAIARRLATAREELKHEREYQRVVVNDDLGAAVAELAALVRGSFGPVVRAGEEPVDAR
jgi:guanylate kinase